MHPDLYLHIYLVLFQKQHTCQQCKQSACVSVSEGSSDTKRQQVIRGVSGKFTVSKQHIMKIAFFECCANYSQNPLKRAIVEWNN